MKKYIYIIVSLVILGFIIFVLVSPGKPGKYDDFAKCINDTKTVTFFGAFWCPHCQAQKARFGKSAKYLPYVECSTPDGRGQLQICKDKNVITYPTWEFGASSVIASTTLITGEIELVELAEKTSCVLPE